MHIGYIVIYYGYIVCVPSVVGVVSPCIDSVPVDSTRLIEGLRARVV